MLRTIGVGLVSSLLSVCATIAVLSWVADEDIADLPIKPTSLTFQIDGVEKVELDTTDEAVGLNVYINKPFSCKEIVESLRIISLPIGEKLYSPYCHNINDGLIKITYIETVSV
jgi:hypothetical protein